MKYVLKRLGIMVLTFLGITIITYAMIRLAPGDATSMKLGLQGDLSANSVAADVLSQERELFGLNDSIGVGYFKWLEKFLRFDLGNSRIDGRPVTTRLAEALPITISLNLITIFIVYIISIPLGIITAVKKDGSFDKISSIILFILYSLPSFWVALLLLMVFASGEYLDVFPLGGYLSDWAVGFSPGQKFLNIVWHLVLPIITLTYGSFAFLAKYTRANMLEVINQQYILTAKAKGLSQKKVVFVHAFRNSLIPLVTLMATLLPGLLGGSVIVETIFSIPGMGKLAYDAILSRDIPLIMAISSISAFLTLIGILIVDLLYGVIDPRVRIRRRA